MRTYQELLMHVMKHGEDRTDRTGVGTRSIFGYEWRHDMRKGFPLLTTKKMHTKSIIHELLWFLKGDTNIKYLNDNGVTIWDEWADENGNLGPVYGKQWREWSDGPNATVDQIACLIDGLKNNPDSRRHIVSAWNVAEIHEMALPPCHTLFQCYVHTDHTISLHLYARSIDAFLGLPFNIASYGLLLKMIAKIVDLIPKDLIISFGDLHIYNNHFAQVREQLRRAPKKHPDILLYGEQQSIDDFKYEDFRLVFYDPHPAISAPIAV